MLLLWYIIDKWFSYVYILAPNVDGQYIYIYIDGDESAHLHAIVECVQIAELYSKLIILTRGTHTHTTPSQSIERKNCEMKNKIGLHWPVAAHGAIVTILMLSCRTLYWICAGKVTFYPFYFIWHVSVCSGRFPLQIWCEIFWSFDSISLCYVVFSSRNFSLKTTIWNIRMEFSKLLVCVLFLLRATPEFPISLSLSTAFGRFLSAIVKHPFNFVYLFGIQFGVCWQIARMLLKSSCNYFGWILKSEHIAVSAVGCLL